MVGQMKKHYAWLWFDADGTLFDFNRAEGIALRNAFQSVSAPFQDEYLATYRRINQQLWEALERREITQSALQVRRFELLLEALQLTCTAEQIGTAYIEHLAACAELIDGAQEVLHTLRGKSQIGIVTNGLQAVQRGRLANSTIRDYIADLVISEEVGASKPKAAFFDAAFARFGHPAKSDVLIIGDSLSADMRGGVDYGIDTCWYNPNGAARPADMPITYEIAHLSDLLDLLA